MDERSRRVAPPYQLVIRANGVTRDAPVPTNRRYSMAPDVGPDQNGDPVVVYSRCAGSSRKRCDIYRLDPDSGVERKVRAVSSSRLPETAPQVWGKRLVFHRCKRMIDGCTTFTRKGEGKTRRLRLAAETYSIDLRRNQAVGLRAIQPNVRAFVIRFRIQLVTIDKRGSKHPCVVAQALEDETGGTSLASPIFDERFLYWLRENDVSVRSRIVRTPLRGACSDPSLAVSERRVPSTRIVADHGRFFYGGDRYTNPRIFEVTDPPLSFRAR
jgi:hypothetical protein